jgi:hypothetical protein
MELLKIQKLEFIGDSLSAININFDIIDSTIKNINFNTDKFLIPYVNFFKENQKRLKFMEDVFYDKKSNWDSMVSFVTINSAKWIKPIVFVDPNVYKFSDSSLQTTINSIVNNFKTFHPVFKDDNKTIPNYIENQKAVVYYYVNNINNTIKLEDVVNSDFANCVSQGTKSIILNCQNTMKNTSTFCNGVETTCSGCAGTPCQQQVSVTCVYPETKTTTTNRYIQAIIRSNFEDIAEKEIKTIFLTMKNCEWAIERIL